MRHTVNGALFLTIAGVVSLGGSLSGRTATVSDPQTPATSQPVSAAPQTRQFTPDPVSISRVVSLESGRTRVDVAVANSDTVLHFEADSIVITATSAGIELRTEGRTTAVGLPGPNPEVAVVPIRLVIPRDGPPQWLQNTDAGVQPVR